MQSNTALRGLNTKINKLLKQEVVEGWYRYYLEDLAEEIQTADKSSITRKKAQVWTRDFRALKEDFGPETEQLVPIKKYR
jgi:hypothetical protein